MTSTYAFLRTPRWIVGHIAVVAIASLFVALGLWQVRRHDERADFNGRIERNRDLPVVPIGAVDFSDPEAVEWRLVSVEGIYAADQIIVRSRTFEGEAGVHLVTPLIDDGGGGVLVKRGWIPQTDQAEEHPPAQGPVAVEGRLRQSVDPPRIGPQDPQEGELDAVYWLNVDRLEPQVDAVLLPMFVELASEQPGSPNPPRPIPIPELDPGPHIAYAVQWFAFALIGVVGYGFLIRRGGRKPAQA